MLLCGSSHLPPSGLVRRSWEHHSMALSSAQCSQAFRIRTISSARVQLCVVLGYTELSAFGSSSVTALGSGSETLSPEDVDNALTLPAAGTLVSLLWLLMAFFLSSVSDLHILLLSLHIQHLSFFTGHT